MPNNTRLDGVAKLTNIVEVRPTQKARVKGQEIPLDENLPVDM